MSRLIIRVLINAVALWVTTQVLPAITLRGGLLDLIIVAVIFGLVNALVKPVVKLLSLPITLLTLGLFALVINALMLMLTASLTDSLIIDGAFFARFVSALIGSIIISIVSTVLSWFLADD